MAGGELAKIFTIQSDIWYEEEQRAKQHVQNARNDRGCRNVGVRGSFYMSYSMCYNMPIRFQRANEPLIIH